MTLEMLLMNFKEAIIYVVMFCVSYNVFEFLRLRWTVMFNKKRTYKFWEVICYFVFMLISITMFAYAIYYNYLTFSLVDGKVMALIMTFFYIICFIILMKKIYLATAGLVKLIKLGH